MKLKWITNPVTIDKEFITTEVASGNNVIVQFDDTIYTDEILSDLNTLALELDTNLEIRFYGHDKNTFDCATLLKVDNVKSLSINCLKKVKNLGELSKLKQLEKFTFGIEEFKETEILNSENLKSIRDLSIATKKTKNLNLEYLKGYDKLVSLSVSGPFKNIAAIGEAKELTTLRLSSISGKVPLDFVNQLNNLKLLHISLGSRDNIDEINGGNIETLKLLWIKNLTSLDNIHRFKHLTYLQVENQAQITTITFNSEMKSLTRLGIINCKGLTTLDGLKNLTSLKMLVITRSLKLDFESVINQELSSSIEHFNFVTERKGLDKNIKEKIRSLGYKTT
ncbi:hypothetical protein QSV08_06770 [Maribacter sp. BPC-D8]|uniref:hypothetical protein n=1 Tax=Maribacter sp. BPC-D8 TaxID=3053613 RepID=UPI002B4845E2|nr:hypothetical protein [Maribacter sp. BPC-D8]WRI30945.1 hypothetical protein QSV08_06770 [Maribacter sp. BPC-D8]